MPVFFYCLNFAFRTEKKDSKSMAKILIVEDDLAFGTMIQAWLKKKGFEVEKATSVKAALDLLEEDNKRDLILSDLRLPDHDGLTLLKWTQKHNLSIPFIVMTSYAEVQNAVLAMKSGATDYIAKPFPPDILLDKIQEAILPPSQPLPKRQRIKQRPQLRLKRITSRSTSKVRARLPSVSTISYRWWHRHRCRS